MFPKYFIMTIKNTYPKISLAIAFTLSTSIGSRTIYTFSNDFSSSCYTFSNDFWWFVALFPTTFMSACTAREK